MQYTPKEQIKFILGFILGIVIGTPILMLILEATNLIT